MELLYVNIKREMFGICTFTIDAAVDAWADSLTSVLSAIILSIWTPHSSIDVDSQSYPLDCLYPSKLVLSRCDSGRAADPNPIEVG